MNASELLRTPANVCFVALTLLAIFLAAHRLPNRWLRIPLRVASSVGAVVCSLLLVFMLFAKGKPNENIIVVENGPYKVLVRSQEFHHSGIINVDVCIAQASSRNFPAGKLPCFLHGFDFSGLSVKWLSQQTIEVSFESGRVTDFRNSAFLYSNGPTPIEFRAVLHEESVR